MKAIFLFELWATDHKRNRLAMCNTATSCFDRQHKSANRGPPLRFDVQNSSSAAAGTECELLRAEAIVRSLRTSTQAQLNIAVKSI